jgi:RNA polymerase sigma-70 factor (ECF subfamily)
MSRPTEEGAIDADLLGRLLDRHGPALALYAAQWTEAADDCVQEAFVELARQRHAPQHVVAWLYRVVKNRALNAARGARRRRERETQSIAERFPVTQQSSSFDRTESLAVVEALDRLETGDREIIMMRIWSGLTYEEIATALSISTSSAYRQYERALEKLRPLLESPCSTNENRSAQT